MQSKTGVRALNHVGYGGRISPFVIFLVNDEQQRQHKDPTKTILLIQARNID
jgi:hypothetical protein